MSRLQQERQLESLVVVSGMSGSGKHTVVNALEDLGYFCVDNIPPSLIPRLVQMTEASGGKIRRMVVVVDIRLRDAIAGFSRVHGLLKAANYPVTLVFVDASDEVLVRRYSETRRVHPLAQDRTLLEGIRLERSALSGIREMAGLVVDTSQFSVHDLKKFVYDRFRGDQGAELVQVSFVSFGFKFGLPSNADLVFDVRFLPNPHFDPLLKPMTGTDPPVVDFMFQQEETVEVLERLSDMLNYLIPRYVREGKKYLTIAIGCTGGRHRSVLIAEELGKRLKARDCSISVVHRDVHRHE